MRYLPPSDADRRDMLAVIGVDEGHRNHLFMQAIDVAGNYSVSTQAIKEYVTLQVGREGLVVFDTIEGHRTWPRDEYHVVYDQAAQDQLTREWCAAWQAL